MAKFEIRALYVIVPFAFAVLVGCLCICKHKVGLWRMRKGDPEAPSAKPQLVVSNMKKADVDKYEAPSDNEGAKGAESESDSILEPGKPRKSLCG